MKCENCDSEQLGEYGSGRFCSAKCARAFSTKANRSEINNKVSLKLRGRQARPSQPCKPETTQKLKQVWLDKLLSADFDSLCYDAKRKRVIAEQHNTCNHCGITEWQGSPITLEVDHINGLNDDNRRENLEAICPNCHSVTDTWRGRNKPRKNGENKVSDEELIIALQRTSTIRQALLSVGLAAKGNNYSRAKKLLL